MKQGIQSWCSGTTQRDGVGREVGGGFRMGGHVHPRLIHVDIWQKPSQYGKVVILYLKYINLKNKRACREYDILQYCSENMIIILYCDFF